MEKNRRRIEPKDVIVELVCILPALITILLYIYTIRFILFSADDFANALEMRNRMSGGVGRFMAVWGAVKDGYLQHQGTWFASIIHFWPLSYEFFRSLWAVRIYQLIADILLFGGSYLLVRRLAKYFYGPIRSCWIYTIIFWLAMNYVSPAETLYWMNGSAVYTIPFGMAMLSIAIFIRYLMKRDEAVKEGKKGGGIVAIIIAMVLGFCSTGGNLVIGGFLCACVLCILLAALRNGRRTGVLAWIYFAVCVAGALVNTLAPGNYIRHTAFSEDGSLDFMSAIGTTFELIGQRMGLMRDEDYLISVIITATAIAALCIRRLPSREYMRMTPIGAAIGSFGCIYAAFFPPVLAFNLSMDNPYLGVRVDFVTGWVMAIAIVFFVVYTVLWIIGRVAKKTNNSPEMASTGMLKAQMVAVICGIVISAAAIGINAYSLASREIEPKVQRFYWELAVGRMKSAYETRYSTLWLYEHSDPGFVVSTQWLTRSQILKDLELSADSTWWVNQAVAMYYDKAGVSYSPPMEDYEIHKDE